MNKSSITKFFDVVKTGACKYSPEILTGIGISCGITTTILAVKATPKALNLIEDKKDELEIEKLPVKETVKATWKCYIPAAVSGIISVSCLIGASSANARRNAALATAYKLADSALSEYKGKVIETIGEEKEKQIRDSIVKDHVDKDPVSNKEVIITGGGDTLCYDLHGGRYFESDIEKIRKAENVLNKKLIDEMYVSLNDLYYELGLSGTEGGSDLGWNLDNGLVEIEFSSQLSDNGKPCLAISYNIAPRYDYFKLM